MNKCFKEIDDDDSGQIDILEFLNYVDVPLTQFSRRVFAIMDEDGSGSMDFREFVIACWNYCSFEKSGLVLFAYDLYDSDHNGTMSSDECKAMFMEVYGKEFTVAEKGFKLFEMLNKISTEDVENFDVITKKQFVKLVNSHVNVLMPAFQIQNAIQNKIMGKRFWNRVTKKRMSGMNGDDWKKHRTNVSAKVDSGIVLRKYQEQQGNEIIERMKNNYRSMLIGRLGEYNPNLDTERRVSFHNKLRDLNYESFEELAAMKNRLKVPDVLIEREPEVGYTTVLPIAKSAIANLPQWAPGTYNPTEDVQRDVASILEWQKTMIASKEITKFSTGAKDGYEFKDNVVSGPVVKIKVDKNSKLIDWSKVKVHSFGPDEANNWEEEEKAREAVEEKKKEKARRRTSLKTQNDRIEKIRLSKLGIRDNDEDDENEEVGRGDVNEEKKDVR
jgi:Ca2+-binding EF-hand superfamily protein